MDAGWQHQIRVYLPEQRAGLGLATAADPALRPLAEVLDAHGATLVSQLDAFEAYVAEAERTGAAGDDPLYRWTKATLDDRAKRRKHAASFAVRVAGQEVYPAATADALEAALRPLVGAGVIARLSRHDTNPANNLPIPPEYRSQAHGDV